MCVTKPFLWTQFPDKDNTELDLLRYPRRGLLPLQSHIKFFRPRRNDFVLAVQKFGFIKRVDKGEITTVKDLESWRFER